MAAGRRPCPPAPSPRTRARRWRCRRCRRSRRRCDSRRSGPARRAKGSRSCRSRCGARRARGSGRRADRARGRASTSCALRAFARDRAPGSARRRGKARMSRATRQKTRRPRGARWMQDSRGHSPHHFRTAETVPTTSAFTARLSRLRPPAHSGSRPSVATGRTRTAWIARNIQGGIGPDPTLCAHSPVDACPGECGCIRAAPTRRFDRPCSRLGALILCRRIGAICALPNICGGLLPDREDWRAHGSRRVSCVRCSGLRSSRVIAGKAAQRADGVQARRRPVPPVKSEFSF